MWEGAEQTYLPTVQVLRHLTRLELDLAPERFTQQGQRLEVCCFLSGLVSLRHLRLRWLWGNSNVKHWERKECLKLCQLSCLTYLSLCGAGQAVGDTVAAALASSLLSLRHLELSDCRVTSETVLPSMARLQHLTQLVLSRNGYAANVQSAWLLCSDKAAARPFMAKAGGGVVAGACSLGVSACCSAHRGVGHCCDVRFGWIFLAFSTCASGPLMGCTAMPGPC